MTHMRRNILRLARSAPLGVVLLLACLLALLPAQVVHADVGPKPSMKFTFEFEGDSATIVSGQLIECDDAACASGAPLEDFGPQGFSCTEDACTSLAYGYADYFKLVIEFSDRTRESNVFEKTAFAARYEVTVSEDALEVQETSAAVRRFFGQGQGCFCCPSVLVTLVLETVVASAYLSLFRLPGVMLAWVPMCSLFTLPAVWLVFPLLPLPSGWTIGLSEGFAVVVEAVLLYGLALRGKRWKHAAALSVAMNAGSFLVGLAMVA